ncbi:hypothetical protein [Polyangium aurulentum]|uniref:hypothetical protein n=1 Tax=Polyangium aurulentum TaxID=2567896 RepID=UPI0010ADD75F|nr:hypothetical protein [Polyangium aurulentum]UQA59399.1 hypothetical protein E8A73_002495 [Polyangium aurulentum]
MSYLVGHHRRAGWVVSIHLLTRWAEDSDFATDISVRRAGIDPTTDRRYLEELAFEIVYAQPLRDILERGEIACARGLRRFFAILVETHEVLELRNGRPFTFAPEDSIEDPCFVRPMEITAMFDRGKADNAVARALLAKNSPAIEELRQRACVQGRATAILDVLTARNIPVPEPIRERILATTDMATLAQWLTRAITADSLDAILDPDSP